MELAFLVERQEENRIVSVIRTGLCGKIKILKRGGYFRGGLSGGDVRCEDKYRRKSAFRNVGGLPREGRG